MSIKWLIVAILLIAVAASGCGDKNSTTSETGNGQQTQTSAGNWCPVGTSWKMANPTTGEEVSMVYTGTKEIDGVVMCVMEYKSTNPQDKVARVEYMFSNDSKIFSWKSYYANDTVMSEMTVKDGNTTLIDEKGTVTTYSTNG